MRKAPSHLKGLAETRTQAERDACDLRIRKFGDRLDPGQIAPIRAFKGRYGARDL